MKQKYYFALSIEEWRLMIESLNNLHNRLILEVIFMARRKDSPQKAAMREMMRDYLKNNDISIKDGTDVNGIMRDMMSVLLEGALDEELDEELGYSKYDYRNKEADNSRNGHSSKTMHISYGDMDVAIPRDRNGDYEPQLIKNIKIP